MVLLIRRWVLLSGVCLFVGNALLAQEKDGNEAAFRRGTGEAYVDPFIGTAKSDVYTKWGNEGGTYPGAVAPWGYLQLTPETRAVGGYDYTDSTICYFSCVHHMSGYPGGSQGRIRVMPVGGGAGSAGTAGGAGNVGAAGDAWSGGAVGDARPFRHQDEKASPGYYRVRFSDDHVLVEATASERVGMFRFTFPRGVAPAIFVGGIGKITRKSSRELQGGDLPAVLLFSGPVTGETAAAGGSVLGFSASATGPTVIVLAISVSPVGVESAEKNIIASERLAIGAAGVASVAGGVGMAGASLPDFDRVKKETQDKWRKGLEIGRAHV